MSLKVTLCSQCVQWTLSMHHIQRLSVLVWLLMCVLVLLLFVIYQLKWHFRHNQELLLVSYNLYTLISCEVNHITANSDYDPSSVTVRFEPNQSISCVLIDITNDDIPENPEEFELVIVPPDGIIVTNGGTTTVTINDEDVIIQG